MSSVRNLEEITLDLAAVQLEGVLAVRRPPPGYSGTEANSLSCSNQLYRSLILISYIIYHLMSLPRFSKDSN